MPSGSALAGLAREALLLAVAVSLPVVAVAALIGLIVAVLQAATQVQDATLGHLPRLLEVAVQTLDGCGRFMERLVNPGSHH